MAAEAAAAVDHRGQLYWCSEEGWQMLAEVGILDLKRKASKVCSFVAIQAMPLPRNKNQSDCIEISSFMRSSVSFHISFGENI